MKFARTIIIVLIFSIFLSARIFAGDYVPINILSKHIRYIKEGEKANIDFIFHPGTVLILANEKRYLSKCKLLYRNHCWYLSGSDDPIRMMSGEIVGPEGQRTFKTIVGKEIREYPYPLKIIINGEVLIFIINEKREQYALDVSIAEYGSLCRENHEAVMALAHVVYAKSGKYRQSTHLNNSLCDLTHCQVYKGIKSGKPLIDDWYIDIQSLTSDLFFHAECGGKTLSEEVFGNNAETGSRLPRNEVRDWINKKQQVLCHNLDSSWTRTLTAMDMHELFFPGQAFDNISIRYASNGYMIQVISSKKTVKVPLESFRLIINRKRGWNFIRSNNYVMTVDGKNSEKRFIFAGKGMGHNVGLCQRGAEALSKLGYGRFEILEHYYRGIRFVPSEHACYSPYVTSYIFDIKSGSIKWSNAHEGQLNRHIAPGSLFKIFTTFYLSLYRNDIIENYQYRCQGHDSDDNILPDRCSLVEGHGIVTIDSALSKSCNLFFSSLHAVLSYPSYKKTINDISIASGMTLRVPPIKTNRDWANMLPGLNNELDISFADMIIMVMLVHHGEAQKASINDVKERIPLALRHRIHNALMDTFVNGTAVSRVRNSKTLKIYDRGMLRKKNKDDDVPDSTMIWGKTATVIDGTNESVGYGLFIGGYGEYGIVTMLRKGNGQAAAQWSKLILGDYIRSTQSK